MNAKEIIRLLQQNGFKQLRQKGSHIRLTNGTKYTTVAVHGKSDIPIGTVKKIEKDTGVKLL
ncbi:MAG: hypothetical protein DRG30_04630 [Epsilonproteobacteria bacterium]|nr:MAG: hypothetical protein DRG30_04630 [Campylobacterota bacterium]